MTYAEAPRWRAWCDVSPSMIDVMELMGLIGFASDVLV